MKDTEIKSDCMSLRECAAFLGQSSRTVSKWVKHAGLPCAQINGGKLIFNRAMVSNWLAEKTRKATP